MRANGQRPLGSRLDIDDPDAAGTGERDAAALGRPGDVRVFRTVRDDAPFGKTRDSGAVGSNDVDLATICDRETRSVG
jgi:hypothetical protein